MRLKVGRVLVYVTNANATGQQTEVAVVPLILNDVNTSGQCGHRLSIAKDVVVGNAVVAVKRSLETVIKHHTTGVWTEVILVYLVQCKVIVCAHV